MLSLVLTFISSSSERWDKQGLLCYVVLAERRNEELPDQLFYEVKKWHNFQYYFSFQFQSLCVAESHVNLIKILKRVGREVKYFPRLHNASSDMARRTKDL